MEQAVVFRLGGDEVLGVLHPGATHAPRGVLVVVGGPQYRVGSHRQFILLARRLAAAGLPVFRFDCRGMGDASGTPRGFEHLQDDIKAAIDVFLARSPGLREVVLWGLCDAASAALFYAWRDSRVAGLVLLNPWVRTEEGLARAYLRHYYLKRVVSREFWAGLMRGRVNPFVSLRSLLGLGFQALSRGGRGGTGSPDGAVADPGDTGARIDTTPLAPGEPLPARMAEGWRRFGGPILLVFSGEDLTAAEFRDTARRSAAWSGLLDQARVTVRELPEANHTFSRRAWREAVEQWTLEAARGSAGRAPLETNR